MAAANRPPTRCSLLLLAAATWQLEGVLWQASAIVAGDSATHVEAAVDATGDLERDDECDTDDTEQCTLSAMQLRASRRRDYGVGADLGGFLSSKPSRSFSWTRATKSISAALSAPGWSDATFAEGSQTITHRGLDHWIEWELFRHPPFGESGFDVPVPWPQDGGDQVGPHQWVAYTRRQVCFIAAKALVGAGTADYPNGLSRFFSGCPQQGHFGKSLVTFLSSCAADPTLADRGQGPLVIVARGAGPPPVEEARGLAASTPLGAAGLRVCQYNDGGAALSGVSEVPGSGCAPPTSGGVGKDFMTGGLPKQAVQDISASFLGGYVFGHACGLGGGQDERLMVYFPEVVTLTFFLSQDWQFPQLRQPAWILGARMFFTGLDGSARFNDPLVLDAGVPLQSDLVDIQLDGRAARVSGSRPFIGFMSENQGFFGNEDYAKLQVARRNKHPEQRLAGNERFAFEKQVRAWYGSVKLSSYHSAVQPVLKELVGSIGTGPWLAGLWWGDSQVGLLSVWIGQALAAASWGGALPVDYYMYSDFTENPGNQCFVHSGASCAACLNKCKSNPLPRAAYWMPDYAMVQGGPCAGFEADCGQHSIADVIQAYSGKSVLELWNDVEGAMAHGSIDKTVFDLLMR